MKKQIYLILFVLLLSSCNKEGYKAPESNVVEMSGRWWMQVWYDADGDGILNQEEDELVGDYGDFGFDFTTSNDAANSKDSLWVMDNFGSIGWLTFKSKLPVDIATKTFKSIEDKENLNAPGETITVVNGKVLPLGGMSNRGVRIDSIFMTLQFSDDPGETYFYSGVKYTGHPEDDY